MLFNALGILTKIKLNQLPLCVRNYLSHLIRSKGLAANVPKLNTKHPHCKHPLLKCFDAQPEISEILAPEDQEK